MKTIAILAASAAAMLAAPSFAQTAPATAATAPAFAAGTKVTDAQGGDVGTIEAVAGDLATVSTGSVKAQLPRASFAANGKGGFAIGMTKAQLEAAAAGAQADQAADLAALLKPGTTVSDASGGTVGKIEAADAQFVTVSTATASSKVKLPVSAFSKGANGPVIAMTATELDAAAKGAAPAGGR